MNKIISFLLFGFLLINAQAIMAKEANSANSAQNSKYTYDVNEDYNFDNNSFYISDEQLNKDAQEIDRIEDNSGFEAKIINSSHFSSGTATRTYIPINKAK